MNLDVAVRQTTVELVFQYLYVDILDGKYPPGDYLRLNDVASALGVSMMPVREAIRDLASLGIVETIPHKGTRVKVLSLEDLLETYTGRLYLETLALKMAITNFDEKQAAVVRLANEARIQALQTGDSFQIIATHEKFHFSIYESCRNVWVLKAIKPGWRNSERYRLFSLKDKELQKSMDEDHGLILDAMEQQDSEKAVRILYHHLSAAAEVVAKQISNISILDKLPSLEALL